MMPIRFRLSAPKKIKKRKNSKAAKSADCKSAPYRVRRFESYFFHHFVPSSSGPGCRTVTAEITSSNLVGTAICLLESQLVRQQSWKLSHGKTCGGSSPSASARIENLPTTVKDRNRNYKKNALMVESVDTLVLETNVRKDVQVQVLLEAPKNNNLH